MLVSVLMSVYRENSIFLRAAIESILNQTYEDFEFVIVGDTPLPDRSRIFSIIEEYVKKDKRIYFLKNDSNLGLPRSLNRGLSICKGKYIARMDADDISLPNRLEKQVMYMENHEDVLALGAWIDFIDTNGNKLGRGVRYASNPERVKSLFLQNSHIAHPVAMFHRIIGGVSVKYSEENKYRYAEDYNLWVSILKCGKISNLPSVLLYYRLSPYQITNEKKIENAECARFSQRDAFRLYDICVDDAFLNLFYKITLMPDYSLSVSNIKGEISRVIGKLCVTRGNISILDSIVSAYDGYMTTRFQQRNSAKHISEITSDMPLLRFIMIIRFYYYKIELKIRILLTNMSTRLLWKK